MSEPTYGSGSSYEGGGGGYSGGPGYQPQGYGAQHGSPQHGGGPQQGAPQYGGPQYGDPQYGDPQYGDPQYGAPYQQPTGPATGGYPGAGGSAPGAPVPRTAAARLGPVAQIVTIVGYVCAGAGLVGFVLLLTVDIGSGAYRLASALQALVVGLGLGGLNVALGSWLAARHAELR